VECCGASHDVGSPKNVLELARCKDDILTEFRWKPRSASGLQFCQLYASRPQLKTPADFHCLHVFDVEQSSPARRSPDCAPRIGTEAGNKGAQDEAR
jgi:hypothetical protein